MAYKKRMHRATDLNWRRELSSAAAIRTESYAAPGVLLTLRVCVYVTGHFDIIHPMLNQRDKCGTACCNTHFEIK